MADKSAIVRVYKFLGDSYPGQEAPKLYTYEDMLDPVDEELLFTAAKDWISKGNRFIPNAGQLFATAKDLELRAEARLTSGEAWDLVMQEVRRVGSYGSPELPPLVLKAVNAVGGWRELCLSTELMVNRAHFYKAYDALEGREVEQKRAHPLVARQIKALAERFGSGLLGSGEARD